MDHEIIIIDQAYKYEVEEILDGGIGYVRLMSMLEYSRKPPDTGDIDDFECAGEGVKYPYRIQIAAKTIKHANSMEVFAGACEPWLGLSMQGIVPLLKLSKHGDETLALMPRYDGNLRSLMQSRLHSPEELLRALSCVVSCLSKIHDNYRIAHQAIKPENILYLYHHQNLVFELSDFGIASVQANSLPMTNAGRMRAIEGYGMLPYLAPERFDVYLSDIRADIFSLGIVCFEILTGRLPYDTATSFAEQIISGEYFDKAETILSELPSSELFSLVMRMIEPLKEERLQNYEEFLALLASP